MNSLLQRIASIAASGRPKKVIATPQEPPPVDPQIEADKRIADWINREGCEDFLVLLEKQRRAAKVARRDPAVQASHIALMKAMTEEDTLEEVVSLIRFYQKQFVRPGHASDSD